MKTRRAQMLDTTFPIVTDLSVIDISQKTQGRSAILAMENGISFPKNEVVNEQLQRLFELLPSYPSLLAGPLRHLKVEPHYREPTSRLWLSPQTYRKTSKIRLTGNWIEKAGFETHERIRVIPMHRMLIIVPETGGTNEHESETNEHE